MARDVRTHLFDIITATQAVDRFTTKVPFEAYLADEILISAVERQYSVIGEAVTQLVKLEPNAPITDARQIIGFRNILIHNYARVSQAVIWAAVKDSLLRLQREAEGWLASLEADPDVIP